MAFPRGSNMIKIVFLLAMALLLFAAEGASDLPRRGLGSNDKKSKNKGSKSNGSKNSSDGSSKNSGDGSSKKSGKESSGSTSDGGSPPKNSGDGSSKKSGKESSGSPSDGGSPPPTGNPSATPTPTPVGGGSGGSVFSVMNYGAQPDGKSDNAQAFIKTWDAACKAGGSTKVLIPAGKFMVGEIVFAGPCASKTMTLNIQGTLLGSPDLSAYDSGVWITLQNVDGLTVTGGGTIDGQGQSVWKNAGGGNLLPPSLVFMHATNSQITGVNLANSKGFHLKVTQSTNIQVSNLHITAPGDSPNTDGIHVSGSTGVHISDSTIGVGDDCISIGDTNSGITVSKITCGPGHGISIGSLGRRPGESDVKGVTVSDCTLTGTTNGVRIKTMANSPSLVASGITFQNIIMEDVANPIIIDQHYGGGSGESNVKIADVHFTNIRGTTPSKSAVTLDCSTKVPCSGIQLADIDLTASAGAATSTIANVHPTCLGRQNPPAC